MKPHRITIPCREGARVGRFDILRIWCSIDLPRETLTFPTNRTIWERMR